MASGLHRSEEEIPIIRFENWRSEKNAKTTVGGSPSAKGTLDNYLRTSQDSEIVHPSCTTRGHDPVKRNLASAIDKSSKNENDQSLLLAESKSQSSESCKVTHKGISLGSSHAGNVASGNPARG